MDIQFEWSETRNRDNIEKHHVSFKQATKAFFDPYRLIVKDTKHSRRRNKSNEDRYYCYGFDGQGILTVRYTKKNHKTRIFGAGYWETGAIIYEAANRNR
ncbi:MAG: BrnT family toxin [Spirochaetaceae bacterium]|jgi:uncharacterized DUF497 family protein|nr:BrnT family toxin [Spirochaetaceae bacterium]